MTSQTHTKITFIWSYIKWIENCAKKQAKLQLLILILNHTFITFFLTLRLVTQHLARRLYNLTITYQQFQPHSHDLILIFGVLTPLSTIFQLYHGDQFQWWRKPQYPEITTDHGQATGKLYRSRVECTLFVIYKAGREHTPYW